MEEPSILYCCSDIGPTTLLLVLKGCPNRLYTQSRVERLLICDLFLIWTMFHRLMDCPGRASAPTAQHTDVRRRFSTFGDHRRCVYSQQHPRLVRRIDIEGKGLTDPHFIRIIIMTVIRTHGHRKRTTLSNSVVVLFGHSIGNRHGTLEYLNSWAVVSVSAHSYGYTHDRVPNYLARVVHQSSMILRLASHCPHPMEPSVSSHYCRPKPCATSGDFH